MPYLPKKKSLDLFYQFLPSFLALSLSLNAFPLAWADAASDHQNAAGNGPIDTNQINQTYNGQIINPGSYYNTSNGSTTFVNTSGGGLWLQGGTVHGYQVGSNNQVNGNGGNINIYAPGSVVRLDGNINVSGILRGGNLGSGGNLNITSAYLYQNGQIYADGSRGGLVQVNVDNLSMGTQALISAKGLGGSSSDNLNGAGGAVRINANGVVDIASRALIVTDGRVVGNYDTNVIAIEGALIRNAGTLSANGVVIDGAASQGGTIRLVANGVTGQTAAGLDSVIANANIRNNTPADTDFNNAVLSARTLLNSPSGNLSNTGSISANGASNNSATPITAQGNAGDGGNILLSAAGNLSNSGSITANGGNGGNSPLIINGGNGGTIAATASGNIQNTGTVQANGGNGSVGNTAAGSSTANSGILRLNQNVSLETFAGFSQTVITQQPQTLASGGTISPPNLTVTTEVIGNSVKFTVYRAGESQPIYTRTIQRPAGATGNNWTVSDTATVSYQVQVRDPNTNTPQQVTLSQNLNLSYRNADRPPANFTLRDLLALPPALRNNTAALQQYINAKNAEYQQILANSPKPVITINVSNPNTFTYSVRPTFAGNGGNAGMIGFGAGGTITNNGSLQANGGNGGSGRLPNAGTSGQGGLIVLSGDPLQNILGTGSIQLNGGLTASASATAGRAGTLVTSNGLVGNQNYSAKTGGNGTLTGSNNTVQRASVNEVLSNNNVLVLLSRSAGNTSLDSILNSGTFRSVLQPLNATSNINSLIGSGGIRHLMLFNPAANSVDLTPSQSGAYANILRSFNSLSVLTRGSIFLGNNAAVELNRPPIGAPDQLDPPYSSAISLLSQNGGISLDNRIWASSIVLKAGNGSINNNGTMLFTTLGKTMGGFINMSASNNIDMGDTVRANGSQMGGSVTMTAGNNVTNAGGFLSANGGIVGGRLVMRAGNAVTNSGNIQVSGVNYGGSITLIGRTVNPSADPNGWSQIQANGRIQNGQIRILRP
ncbi:MAG: hypothetical protein K2X01_04690 [Cyanobacteria bacterium]|nr:hypothetical protein [Cyanobacteriota bacterium]